MTERVYIGRPSYWGNPYRIGVDGNRTEVIGKFREYFYGHQEMQERALVELIGKELVCHCKPSQSCHGDVLREFLDRHANAWVFELR